LLERVVDNLATNALKHTPAGGRVTLRAVAGPEPGRVSVDVEDTGEGIPKAWHRRIFEKFSQVEMRKHGFRHDSGLGLAFCRLAVEGMGGRIELASEPGAGATFTVRLRASAAATPVPVALPSDVLASR
jgi:signal transduction histidine kinase